MYWVVIILLIVYDYLKMPIDRLYFKNPIRPLVGICNTITDMVTSTTCPGLWRIRCAFPQIREEFMRCTPHLEHSFFHDTDPWFDKNDRYIFYTVNQFPILNAFIDTIPRIHKETAKFACIDGPMYIPPHRAESNWLLRYHLTIEAVPGECTLYTHTGAHDHLEGDSFLFDHSRYHELIKRGPGRRVVLILDIKRF